MHKPFLVSRIEPVELVFSMLTAPSMDRPALYDSGYHLHPDPLPFASRQMIVFLLPFVEPTKEEILTLWFVYLPSAFIVSTRLRNIFTVT